MEKTIDTRKSQKEAAAPPQSTSPEETEKDLKVEDPLSVFRTFYEEVQGVPLDEKEEAFMSRILEKAREEI